MIANFAIQIPLMFIMSVCALSVSVYGIIDFNGDNFFTVLAVFAINLWVGPGAGGGNPPPRETRFCVYKEAPGYRPGPRASATTTKPPFSE